MGTFEILVWMVLVSVVLGLIVTGIAVTIGMLVEIYEADARRVRKWLRGFFAARKEAGT